jgi:hypothetical protein
MNKKNIIFHSLFLLFISIWLASIINIILNNYVNNSLTSSSISQFSGYFGLLFWVIVGASASASFLLGLDKLGILQPIWKKIFVKYEGYEPEIYVATEKPNTISSAASSMVIQQPVIEQKIEDVSINNEDKISAIQKDRKKTTDRMKAFYLFGETEFKQCQHKFGYLKKKLKNKPIPDECFGCPTLLECFKTTKKSKKKKHELATNL